MATHSSTLAQKIPWTESPVGCSPWGGEESDMTEGLHFTFTSFTETFYFDVVPFVYV